MKVSTSFHELEMQIRNFEVSNILSLPLPKIQVTYKRFLRKNDKQRSDQNSFTTMDKDINILVHKKILFLHPLLFIVRKR